MVRIIIAGYKGRMGAALIACAANIPHITVAARVDQGDDIRKALPQADVVIDFSTHSATADIAAACAAAAKPLVIGTTGHSDEQRQSVLAQAAGIPMVWSSNFSTGVNTLFWLTRKAAEILGPSYDIEVIETHHRLKTDAPSGTAKTLAEILTRVRGLQLPESARYGRSGITGERTSTEIGIHSIRAGDVVGDHTVLFAAQGERVELTHKASNRETFANGALRAATWLPGRKPGLYSMEDVLGLSAL